MRRLRARLAHLFALLFSCIFLLNLVSSLGVGQLAAYSETRSFRDALEGRSMEEAISGPVDKDTSSYGDRTSGSPNGSGSQQASQTAENSSGSNYGGSTQAQGEAGANSNAGQMMINIPANGNLNPITTQQRTSDEPADEQQQQQSSANGGAELEREAGPISADFPIDTQQMSMEQKMIMMMKAKQMMAGRSGRLTGPAPSSAMMVEMMMRAMKEEAGRRKPMGRMGARSGRLQQEQEQQRQEDDQQQKSDKSGEETGNKYGPSSVGGPAQMAASANGYGKKMLTMNKASAYDDNMQNGQQQQVNGGQESGYENPSEQEEMMGKMQQMSKMAAGSESMRAKYNRMMNGAGMDSAYKRQQANMGQSMMMSLANKAAYMANQKSQREVVPMMTMMMQQNGDGASGYKASMPMGGGSYGQTGAAMSMQTPKPMTMKRANYQSMGAMGAMRAMRRANQRRAEKKISPAMMNAMLNKMLAGSNEAIERQYQAEEPTQKAPASSGNYNAGQQMSKMRAELMAQMMMMKMSAANGNGYGGAMGSSDGNGNKLSKMMSAMQQQQQMKDESEEDQKATPMNQMNGGSNYGDRSSASSRPMMMANVYNSQEAKSPVGYGQDSMSSTTTPSSYESASMGPSTSSRSPMAGYGLAQQMPMKTAGYDGQEQQQQQEPMSADTKGMQQPVIMMKSYGMSSPSTISPMMASVRMAPKMNGYGDDSAPSERPTNGKLMQQVMKMMRAKQVAMGGQGKSAYAAGDQQQQTEAKDYGASSQAMQPNGMGYGTKSKPSVTQTQEPEHAGVKGQPMNRPMMPMSMGMSYDSQDQQQQQQQVGSGDGGLDQQQQTMGDYGQGASGDQYGAAPMGQAEPFAFDYKVEDEATGNNQYRKEESDKNGVVRGSYGYMDSNSGIYRHVEYVADENGFRANIKSNEPGLSDKTATSGAGQQQQPEMAGDRSSSRESMGTKSGASEAAGYQPERSQSDTAPPPSSSSSLGGSSAAIQQEPTKTSAPMEDQMARQQMQMAARMPQEQQQTDEKK